MMEKIKRTRSKIASPAKRDKISKIKNLGVLGLVFSLLIVAQQTVWGVTGTWGPTITEPTCVQENALRGKYYQGPNFDSASLKKARNDPTVNFNWGAQTPDASTLESDNFGVRWTGFVNVPQTGTWVFYAYVDDRVRLYVNSQLIIDKWFDQNATEHSGTINLSAGWYPIQMDFYENKGDAVARLSFSGPATPKQVVPQTNLKSCTAPATAGLSCTFTEVSSGSVAGSGTESDPYKVQKGTESIGIRSSASPNPGGGTTDFSVIFPGGTSAVIANDVPYANGSWTKTWTDNDPAKVTSLEIGSGYSVRAHFDGFGGIGAGDSFCYFTVAAPASSEFIISARGSIDPKARSFRDWKLPFYSEGDVSGLNPVIVTPTYDQLFARFGKKAVVFTGLPPDTTGVWRRQGDLTISSELTFSSNRQVLIFVDGAMTINAEIHLPKDSAVAFVVKGSIKFSKNLIGGTGGRDEVEGLYIAEGEVNTGYDAAGLEVTRRLIISGALISLKDTLVFKRNLSEVDNTKLAAEQIKFEPKYHVLMARFLGKPQVSWREIAP